MSQIEIAKNINGNVEDTELSIAGQKVNQSLAKMQTSVKKLIATAQKLTDINDQLNLIGFKLRNLEISLPKINSVDLDQNEKIKRQTLQSLFNILYAANQAESLLNLGEYRRKYLALSKTITSDHVDKIDSLLQPPVGLFNIRYNQLVTNLEAKKNLIEIKNTSSKLNNLIANYIAVSESSITALRKKTSEFIVFAQIIVVAIVIACSILALIVAYYISNYIAKNINTISTAMINLAKGENDIPVLENKNTQDEIGKLIQAYQIFSANALRLKRLNTQMRQKTALFEGMFNNITDGIAITDANYNITNWNAILNNVVQYNLGKIQAGDNINEVILNSGFGQDFNSNSTKNGKNKYIVLKNEGGNTLEIRSSKLPNNNCIWLFTDVTERKQIEDRLFQFQRLESLGLLTGEVAHDFNNILTTIETNLHLIETSEIANKNIVKITDRISSAIEIGATLTHRLLAFARKQHLVPESIELVGLIRSIEELIQFSLSDKVSLQLNLPDDEIWVNIDPGQMENALLNICLNANHAIVNSGVINITVQHIEQKTALINISDTGKGMDQKVLNRVFEPFFTTKSEQEGSGLGLSMVFGFINQSGGQINIVSELDKGTEVSLSIPSFDESSDSPVKIIDFNANHSILFVEDDKLLLYANTKSLRSAGLNVKAVNNFIDAKAIIEAENEYDILFTDVHLEQDKNGWDLAKIFLEQNPNRTVIVSSGNEREANNIYLDQYKNMIFLPKPYSRQQLFKIVKNIEDLS
ncbi:MAG: response regulator [Rhizobiales bacterium]|nr:ATP-binding protein [Hyphomicrobiales bacterium]NRB15858.1 response regulator [Hyphomicrobiales bacterium]